MHPDKLEKCIKNIIKDMGILDVSKIHELISDASVTYEDIEGILLKIKQHLTNEEKISCKKKCSTKVAPWQSKS